MRCGAQERTRRSPIPPRSVCDVAEQTASADRPDTAAIPARSAPETANEAATAAHGAPRPAPETGRAGPRPGNDGGGDGEATGVGGDGTAARTAPGAGQSGEPVGEQIGEPGGEPKSDSAVVRDALGVGVAVGLSGFAFGVTSAGAGLTVLQSCALSLLVFTGASQFALVGALAAGGNPDRRGRCLLPRRTEHVLRPAPVPTAGTATLRTPLRRPMGHRRDDGRRARSAHTAQRAPRLHRHRAHPLRAVEPHHASRRARGRGHRRHRRLGARRGRPRRLPGPARPHAADHDGARRRRRCGRSRARLPAGAARRCAGARRRARRPRRPLVRGPRTTRRKGSGR